MNLFNFHLGFIIVTLTPYTIALNMVIRTVEISRATTYAPKVIDKTCLLKPETGPCRSKIPMYYYDPPAVNCSTFTWGGCQGNGNRFDSLQECQLKCWSQPNPPKVRPNYCSLTFDYGYCFGAVYRWYYDKLWKVCKQTIYSGCGGNKNNFYNIEQCEAICRFGNGMITVTKTNKDKRNKVIIINPWQHTRTTSNSTVISHGTTCMNVTEISNVIEKQKRKK